MHLNYLTQDPKNAIELAQVRLGYKVDDYDKEGNRIYPIYQGRRINVEQLAYGEIDNDVYVLGSEYIVTSMLQLYKNGEISQLEFELFSDVILKEGDNDLFRRHGITFICYNKELTMKIRSMIDEVKSMFHEVVMQYAPDLNIEDIPIAKDHYIDMVQGEDITWFLFSIIHEPYLDMTIYELLSNGGNIWYNFSSLFSDSSSYIEEKFTYAYEIITGKRNHDFNVYSGMRVTTTERLDIMPLMHKLNRVMSEFTVITKNSLLDSMRVKTYFAQRNYTSRIFKDVNSTYYILVHGFVDDNPSINNTQIDGLLRSNILKRLTICQNDEDVVSLEKFETLDLLELLHIVPHPENGFTFCFSDEYDLNTNPYTRSNLNKNNIKKHYYNLFTM